MRRSVEQVLNNAASEMRAPTRFGALVDSLQPHLQKVGDEAMRELGVPGPSRRADTDWEGLVEALAEEGNLFLVFDGASSEVPFVMGDEEAPMRACFLVVDPVPFERPLTAGDEFVVAREGFNGWTVREYRPSVLETIFELGEEPGDGESVDDESGESED
jgi:hypothetical protein